MVEAMCITSHDQPGTEPGRFKRYKAGRVYEIPELNRYFKKVNSGTLKKSGKDAVKGVKENDSV